jgi:hypothetical protein
MKISCCIDVCREVNADDNTAGERCHIEESTEEKQSENKGRR